MFERLVELGYFQAFAGIALPNAASIALHEAVGFTALGLYRNVGHKLGAGTTWAGGNARCGRRPSRSSRCASSTACAEAMLRQRSTTLIVPTRGRGLVEVTRPVTAWLAEDPFTDGLLTVFVRHTRRAC